MSGDILVCSREIYYQCACSLEDRCILVLLLSYSKSLFVGVTWASLIVFFYLSRRIFVRKKIKENILDSVGLFSYLWQNFLSLLLWKLSQRWDKNLKALVRGYTLSYQCVSLSRRKLKGPRNIALSDFMK